MRREKNYIVEPVNKSSFLSCEKDAETIIKKLFVDDPYVSKELKRLLLINTKDCLDDRTNQVYKDKINNTSLADLIDNQYIRLKPLIKFGENEEVKSYICLSFDNFYTNNSNSHYRDHMIEIDIFCHIDQWDLGNFRIRPLKIAGYIDSLLDGSKLAGIGNIEFVGCNELILSETLAGYCLTYRTVNAEDDKIQDEEYDDYYDDEEDSFSLYE